MYLLTYGGPHKTFMLYLERCQRAILEASKFLPFYYLIKDLYESSGLLSVLQLFILNILLRKHSYLKYYPLITTNKRRTTQYAQVINLELLSHKDTKNFLDLIYTKLIEFYPYIPLLDQTTMQVSNIQVATILGL